MCDKFLRVQVYAMKYNFLLVKQLVFLFRAHVVTFIILSIEFVCPRNVLNTILVLYDIMTIYLPLVDGLLGAIMIVTGPPSSPHGREKNDIMFSLQKSFPEIRDKRVDRIHEPERKGLKNSSLFMFFTFCRKQVTETR